MIDTKKLREFRGIRAQKDIAERAGIAQNTYSQIEKGIRGVSLDVASRIAMALGVTVNDLLPLNPSLPPKRQRNRRTPGAGAKTAA